MNGSFQENHERSRTNQLWGSKGVLLGAPRSIDSARDSTQFFSIVLHELLINNIFSLTKRSLKGSYSISKGGVMCAAPVGSPVFLPVGSPLSK